jgi:hypothetical protein
MVGCIASVSPARSASAKKKLSTKAQFGAVLSRQEAGSKEICCNLLLFNVQVCSIPQASTMLLLLRPE